MDLHRCLQSHRYLSVDESLFTIGLSQSIFIFWCIYSSRLRTPSWCSAFRVASQFGLRPHCFSSWEVCGRFCFFTFRGHCVHTDGQTDGGAAKACLLAPSKLPGAFRAFKAQTSFSSPLLNSN